MRTTSAWLLALGPLIVSCAAAYNRNFPLIEKRMTLSQVTALIGKPESAASGPDDSKILYYRLAASFLDTDGSDTREYWVLFMDGQVIGYGERTDAMTVMREARQFTAAWNASKAVSHPSKPR